MTVRDTLLAATQTGDPLDQALFTLLINSFAVLGDDGLATDAEVAAAYQPLLVSGTTIKTINGVSLLGSGNIVLSGGGGSLVDAHLSGDWQLEGGYGTGGLRRFADSGAGYVGVAFYNYFGNLVGTIAASNGGGLLITTPQSQLQLATTCQYGRFQAVDANGGSTTNPLYVLDDTLTQEGGFYCQRTGGEANVQKWCSGRVDRVALDRTGNLEFKSGTTVILNPAASVTPVANGNLVIQATSNTSLTFKLRGSDGTVRSGSIALS